VLSTVGASLITPGDVVVLTVFLMIPLILLYEFSILLVKLVEGRRSDAESAASEEPYWVEANR
jgi:sec-independent protein translocase protein TatC